MVRDDNRADRAAGPRSAASSTTSGSFSTALEAGRSRHRRRLSEVRARRHRSTRSPGSASAPTATIRRATRPDASHVRTSTPLTDAIDAQLLHRPARSSRGSSRCSSASAALLAIPFLAVAQYPIIAPPSISISTSYPGASPENLYNSVTRLIEEELNGANGILNFESTSDSLGQVEIIANFVPGTDSEHRPRSRCRTASSASRRGCRAPSSSRAS